MAAPPFSNENHYTIYSKILQENAEKPTVFV